MDYLRRRNLAPVVPMSTEECLDGPNRAEGPTSAATGSPESSKGSEAKLDARLVVGVVLPLAVAVALLFLAGFSVQSTNVSAEVESEAITLRLSESWSMPGALHLDSTFHLTGVHDVSVEPAGALELREGGRRAPVQPFALSVAGRRVQVSRFSLSKGAYVELVPRGDRSLTVFVRQGIVEAQLYVVDSARVSVGPRASTTVRRFDGLALDLSSESDRAVPIRLDLRPEERWTLRNIQVDSVAFVRERRGQPTEATFESSVLGGLVVVEDVGGQRHSLREGARMTLAGFKGEISKLAAGASIHSVLEGSTSSVRVGSERSTRSLKPSVLEDLYHNSHLRIGAGVLVAVWGLALSLVGAFSR